jgi:hypothetical protein
MGFTKPKPQKYKKHWENNNAEYPRESHASTEWSPPC